MSTMRAVVYDPPAHCEVREIVLPEPGRDEVLLTVVVAGPCATDIGLGQHGGAPAALADNSVTKSVIVP